MPASQQHSDIVEERIGGIDTVKQRSDDLKFVVFFSSPCQAKSNKVTRSGRPDVIVARGVVDQVYSPRRARARPSGTRPQSEEERPALRVNAREMELPR